MIRSVALAAAALAVSTSAFAASVPVGLWRMESGKADIRIADCSGAPCATIVALKKPNDRQGRPKRDKRNPDPALQGRPVIGVSLLSGMTPDGDGWKGAFYNPDDGRTYAGAITPDGADRLKLRGCVVGVLCRTQALTRLR